MRWLAYIAVLGIVTPSLPVWAGGKQKPCVTAEQATKMLDKDVCITAHVYDVVELPDGTRYLDVCSPDTPDAQCRFTIISPWEDREEVGELRKYRDMDVHVRGIVRSMHGRTGLVLSHARQFYGGPPRFAPNPRLLHGFMGDQDRPPIHDPGVHASSGQRGFMSTRSQVPVSKAPNR